VVGDPPRTLPSDLVSAFSESDDLLAIARRLVAELHDRLQLESVSVHQSDGDGFPAIAFEGLLLPGSDGRAAAVAAGGTDTGYGCALATDPPWIVLADRAGGLDAAQRQYADMVCQAAAIGVVHARREHALRMEALAGRTLVELTQTLSLERGESQVLHLLVLAVRRLVSCAGVAAWVPLDDGGYQLAAATGYHMRVAPQLGARLPAAVEFTELTASRRVREIGRDDVPGLCQGERASVVPIGEQLAVRALLVVERVFEASSADERLLLGVADQALLTLENERLVEELQGALDSVVACLGRALAVRHRGTGEHSDRLTVDCVAVARALGLQGEGLRDVAYAAALHDLGKIGVPERILDGTGPLSDEGWQLIRSHPELGAQIVDAVPALSGAAALIRACHEHWDGSGYPLGLQGEQIPQGARIVFACDAYHAMREQRSYQDAMSRELALARMQELRGIHFDPAVVDALVDQVTRQSADDHVGAARR